MMLLILIALDLAYDSIMCGYFPISFIDFMLAGETLTGFASLFSPNNF